MTIRLNFRALLRPLCWLGRHGWKDYFVLHPMWNREGRYCTRCGLSQLVKYNVEFTDDNETITVRTDWNGTQRWVWRTTGEGTQNNPIHYEKEFVPPRSEETTSG